MRIYVRVFVRKCAGVCVCVCLCLYACSQLYMFVPDEQKSDATLFYVRHYSDYYRCLVLQGPAVE